MLFHIFLLVFCQEVHSDEHYTTASSQPTNSPTTSSPMTATTASSIPTTTAASLYCEADKCDRHSILIYDLEQKFKQLQNDTRDLRSEIEILKEDNEDLNRENKMIKEDLKVLKEENDKLKNENENLRGDVKELQGKGSTVELQLFNLNLFLVTYRTISSIDFWKTQKQIFWMYQTLPSHHARNIMIKVIELMEFTLFR